MLTENRVSIACNVGSAFAYVTNMENFAQWFPNVRSVVSADTQPHATLGKQYVEVVSTPRGEQKISLRVKARCCQGWRSNFSRKAPVAP